MSSAKMLGGGGGGGGGATRRTQERANFLGGQINP